MLPSSSLVARQGYICSKCEHSPIRAWYRVSGAILCDFRRTLMPCDAAPVYCVAFKCADVTAAPMVREGGRHA
ncbi:MAG: hypothetical protein ACLU6O_01235 [Bilophila wadsworthia]